MTEINETKNPEFKLPTFSGTNLGASAQKAPTAEGTLPDSTSDIKIKEATQKKPSKSKSSSIADSSPKVPIALSYNEPEWSGDPPDDYSFEIIKQGTVISTVKCQKSFLVVGRLPKCDIPLEHPTISRHHAVIQYCKGTSDKKAGFYLYDLGSTHGTFVNKEEIHKKVYYLLKVGYVIKFGFSTRLFVFQGPEDEKEEEKSLQTSAHAAACDWGMGEDAEEEEEEDLADNPFALTTANEELYISDPKKTLRGWFEREGYDLQYNVEEKGPGNFTCSIQLPIDNPSGDYITVDATVKGKKKEAVVACALEACQMLDRFNLLRQSQHESHQRKKKKWEEDDFYDSDEDPFLDRTGTLEKKREWRKQLDKKNISAENHESIMKKLNDIVKEIEEIKEKLRQSRATKVQAEDVDVDSLDSYMLQISDNKPLDPITKSKLKMRLVDLEKNKITYEKLLDVSVSAQLPPRVLPISSATTSIDSTNTESCKKSEVKMIHEKQPVAKVEKSINISTESTTKFFDKEEDRRGKQKTDSIPKIENKRKVEVKCPTLTSEKNKEPPQKKAKTSNKDFEDSADYCMWVPPSNQTGDGSTHLNTKFGY